MADNIPIVLTTAGRVNTPPATLLAQIIAIAETLSPGLTADLPATLIEDAASTGTGGAVLADQALTDLINSASPYATNAFLLAQLGAIYGVTPGQPVNTSVLVVFSGTIGFLVQKGFVVSDGTNQYVVQTGAAVGSDGTTGPVFCVASQAGTFPVPANTVTTIITSVPSPYTLTATNPSTGIPASGVESEESYRARVIQAGLASATGYPTMLKTLLGLVPGVQQRLISVRQGVGGYEVIVGGGDPFAVAFAIYQALFDITSLVPSVTGITNITQANPGIVTTSIDHGFTTGEADVHIAGVLGMTAANGGPYTVTTLTPTTFSFGVNTSGFGAYTSGGAATPNTRNVTVSLIDYPDTYVLTFVVPIQQTVALTLTWNTTATNAISDAAVAQLGNQPLVDYINSLPVGQPINGFVMQTAFQAAVASIIPPALLDRMVFTVSINGTGVTPESGTQLYFGDPEGFFETSSPQVTINQG